MKKVVYCVFEEPMFMDDGRLLRKVFSTEEKAFEYKENYKDPDADLTVEEWEIDNWEKEQ